MLSRKESSKSMDPLLEELGRLGEGSSFLWLIFIFTITPTVFNGLHSMSHIFTAEVPSHWCSVPVLTAANWTDAQVREISSATPCTVYEYDYAMFAKIGYEEALNYKTGHPPNSTSACTSRTFADDAAGKTSLVQDWDLVCENTAYRSNMHMALSLGKLIGSGFFGVFADKFGRKLSYVIGIALLIGSGPASAVVPWYWGFFMLRLITGVSHAAIQYSSFTTLTEVAGERHRQWMGIAYNVGYATGISLTPGIAYALDDWRHVQMAISLPALFLLIHMWLMPESPRWLISQDRRNEAEALIAKASHRSEEDSRSREANAGNAIAPGDRIDMVHRLQNDTARLRLRRNIKGFKLLVTSSKLRKRLIITNISWMTASLSYYALALNVNNFTTNRYIYVLVMGLTEIPAYLIPTPILMRIGRRPASAILYCLSAVFLLCILLIPTSETTVIMTVALIGRFILSTVYGIVILYTSELFPTVCRNSAIGTNSAMSHVGSVAAPYVVDLLGAMVWWAPTTLCGGLAVVAGVLCSILPETRGKSLTDTIDEETSIEDRNLVSLKDRFLGRRSNSS